MCASVCVHETIFKIDVVQSSTCVHVRVFSSTHNRILFFFILCMKAPNGKIFIPFFFFSNQCMCVCVCVCAKIALLTRGGCGGGRQNVAARVHECVYAEGVSNSPYSPTSPWKKIRVFYVLVQK